MSPPLMNGNEKYASNCIFLGHEVIDLLNFLSYFYTLTNCKIEKNDDDILVSRSNQKKRKIILKQVSVEEPIYVSTFNL